MSQSFPVAVRSLQCSDHATNIPPSVLGVQWNTSKRCNFDCSYCSPHVHDAVSPWLDLDQAVDFAQTIDRHCAQKNQSIKWVFTGGEPFIDPGFLDLARYISALGTTHQLNVTTNGSVAASMYRQAMEIFDGITVSLHLERSEQEIQSTLDKLPMLNTGCMLSVNLMFLPGHLTEVERIVDWLRSRNISFVVRKIVPNDNDTFLPFVGHSVTRKHRMLLDTQDQVTNKMQSKMHNDIVRQDRWKDLYSPAEVQYLETINTNHNWVNCGVWYRDGSYHEHNSDFLLSRGMIQFKDWTCWAGVDSLFVDFDGSIYRGMCLNDGAIGHISQRVGFQDRPTICQRHWCTCNVDIAVRKASESGMIHVSK